MNHSRHVSTLLLAILLLGGVLGACGEQAPPPPTAVPPTPTAAITPTPSAGEHLDKGNDYLDQGQFDQAIAEFQAAIQLDPDLTNAHYNLGLAYQKQDKLDEAAAAYQEAIQLDPDLAEAHNNLGLIYDTQGKSDQAIAEYQEAIGIDPGDDKAHYNLALLYYHQGELDPAIAEYEETIRLNPDNADAHYNLGRAYYEQGKLDEAIVAWKESIRTEPGDSMAHNNLGRAYFDQGRFEESVAELREAASLDAENPLPHVNLGLVYRQQGLIEEAIAEFETYLELTPPDDSNRTEVEQEIENLKGPSAEYKNAAAGYALPYPSDLHYAQDGVMAVFSQSQVAVEAALDFVMAKALQEAPLAMFDAMPLDKMAADYDLEAGDDPVEFQRAIAQDLGAKTGEMETGNLQGYPAALVQIMGEFDGTSYIGVLGVVLVEERVIAATAMAQPAQWEAFGPTFMTMFNKLSFFEPEE
ncbi:MAG: tetratricopeptide repeat protein [Anaerolineae bacterium]|jgi:Tfp pilus assembly protein PilF